jgi:YD repeat-containing protein
VSQTAASAVATTNQTAGGAVTSYALYDGLGQQVQSQSPAVSGGTVVTDTAYDSRGRVAFADNPYWTTSVDPSPVLFVPASLSEIGSQTVTNYDAQDRVVSTVTNSYATERFRTTNTYLGADRVDVTPPAGGTPTSTFTNSLGQKTKLLQYLAPTPDGSATTEATTYEYNVQGKMSAMTDPAGNAWSWGFDVLGYQVTATDPDTGTTTSTYDDAGNLLTSTDARGVTLSYTYDELNRKTAEYNGTTNGAKLASWTYDTVAKGQPTGSTSYVGSTAGTPGAAYSSTVTGYDDLYGPTGTMVSLPASAPGFGASTFTTAATYQIDG